LSAKGRLAGFSSLEVWEEALSGDPDKFKPGDAKRVGAMLSRFGYVSRPRYVRLSDGERKRIRLWMRPGAPVGDDKGEVPLDVLPGQGEPLGANGKGKAIF
jgi:hypothetical protein